MDIFVHQPASDKTRMHGRHDIGEPVGAGGDVCSPLREFTGDNYVSVSAEGDSRSGVRMGIYVHDTGIRRLQLVNLCSGAVQGSHQGAVVL